MSSDVVKVVYLGPYSGLFLSELGIEVQRGVAFEAPKKWADKAMELEPGIWKLASAKAPVRDMEG